MQQAHSSAQDVHGFFLPVRCWKIQTSRSEKAVTGWCMDKQWKKRGKWNNKWMANSSKSYVNTGDLSLCCVRTPKVNLFGGVSEDSLHTKWIKSKPVHTKNPPPSSAPIHESHSVVLTQMKTPWLGPLCGPCCLQWDPHCHRRGAAAIPKAFLHLQLHGYLEPQQWGWTSSMGRYL